MQGCLISISFHASKKFKCVFWCFAKAEVVVVSILGSLLTYPASHTAATTQWHLLLP